MNLERFAIGKTYFSTACALSAADESSSGELGLSYVWKSKILIGLAEKTNSFLGACIAEAAASGYH